MSDGGAAPCRWCLQYHSNDQRGQLSSKAPRHRTPVDALKVLWSSKEECDVMKRGNKFESVYVQMQIQKRRWIQMQIQIRDWMLIQVILIGASAAHGVSDEIHSSYANLAFQFIFRCAFDVRCGVRLNPYSEIPYGSGPYAECFFP